MKKKIFAPLAILAVSLTLSIGVLAESHSKNLDLEQKVQVNGTTLQPGSYKVQWDANGSTAQVKFLKGKKEVASAPAQLKNMPKRSDGTSVVLGNKSEVPTLDEIDFGGMTQALVLSGANATQSSGE